MNTSKETPLETQLEEAERLFNFKMKVKKENKYKLLEYVDKEFPY
jgi:hypothetical protein